MFKTFLLLYFMGTAAWVQAQDSASGPAPIPPSSRLYNGIDHPGYNYKIKGFAYFQQPGVLQGKLVYDELTFSAVPIWYDLVKDQVIIQHYNGFNRIGLVSEKVKEFTLGSHRFIRLEFDSLSLPTGFYELLYDGKTQAVARYTKVINRVLKQEVEEDFKDQTAYYIRKDKSWHSVKTYSGLAALFGEQSKAIKQYLRKNDLKFKKDPVNTIVKAAAYYDSLNQ